MSEELTHDNFAEQLDTSFDIYFTPEHLVPGKLIEVTEVHRRAKAESFAILFLVPPGSPIEQGLFRVEHRVLGASDLFLVPVKQTAEGIQYESIFNRLTT